MRYAAIPCLLALIYYAYALHRALGMKRVWWTWKHVDISALLTGNTGALVDRAFYLSGAGIALSGFVLLGLSWPTAAYAVGGTALAGAAFSRAVWPNQRVHILCALLAFTGTAAGNAYCAYVHGWWPVFALAALPLPLVGVWRMTDQHEQHVFEWAAAGAVLAALAVLLVARLVGYGASA